MTVKQLHSIMPTNEKMFICWNGLARELDRANEMEILAYGDYVISRLLALSESVVEIELMAHPVKAVTANG